MPLSSGRWQSSKITLDSKDYFIDLPTYQRVPVSQSVSRATPSDIRWGDLDIWDYKVFKDWTRGRGIQWDRGLEGFYWESRNVDGRFSQTLSLAPLQTVIGAGAGGATALNGNPVRFQLFSDSGTVKLFVAAGTKVYIWDATNNDWDDDTAGAAATVTDIVVYKNVLYVAQGATAAREKTGGAWAAVTNNWTAKRLWLGINVKGEWALYRSGPTAGTDAHQISFTTDGDTWSTYQDVGDASSEINKGIYAAGQNFIGKEDGLYGLPQDDRPRLIMPFFSQKASGNFDAMTVWHSGELFLDALYGVWIGDGQRFSEIGPERNDGFESDRWGTIDFMLPTVNFVYAAVNGGSSSSRYSSIIAWNGAAWHDVVLGAAVNKPIQALAFTPAGVIESEARLWFGYGTQAGYIIVPDSGERVEDYSSQTYASTGDFYETYFDARQPLVLKDWYAVDVFLEGAGTNETCVVKYRVDNETSNTTLGTANSNGQTTITFAASTTGRRIQLVYTLARGSTTTNSPRVKAVRLKYLVVPTAKYVYSMDLILAERGLTGETHELPWDTQLSNFWTSYEKTEPITFIDPFGTSKTVSMRRGTPPRQAWIKSEDGEIKGARISLNLAEV